MNIHQVNIFNIAARTLSITKTAKQINLSQPSVSIQIKDLECSLNVKLFNRINKKISLTAAGETFLEYSDRLLTLIGEIHKVMADFGAGDVGRLALGASSTVGSYILPSYLGSFKELHPKADLCLSIQNRKEVLEQCLSGEIDIAFMQGLPKNQILQSEFFMKDELVIVCSPRHRWAGREYLTLKTLKLEPDKIIMREQGSGTRYLIEKVLEQHGIEFKIIMEMSSSEGIKRAIEANLGIGVLSKNIIINEIKNRSLVALPIKDLNTSRDFYIVRNKKQYHMQLIMKFFNFILEKSRDMNQLGP